MPLNELPRLVQLAKEQAEKSNHPHHRHGAVLAAGRGKVLSVGYNDVRGHAEERVMNKIPTGFQPENMILVVVRINNSGNLLLSKPCEDCRNLIEEVGIGEVYYS